MEALLNECLYEVACKDMYITPCERTVRSSVLALYWSGLGHRQLMHQLAAKLVEKGVQVAPAPATRDQLEALADIAFTAGQQGYHVEDSRQVIGNLIEWALEFDRLHRLTDWEEVDYIETIDAFTDAKLSKGGLPPAEPEEDWYGSESEHEEFTYDDWKSAVACEETTAGYNEWVHNSINEQDNDQAN